MARKISTLSLAAASVVIVSTFIIILITTHSSSVPKQVLGSEQSGTPIPAVAYETGIFKIPNAQPVKPDFTESNHWVGTHNRNQTTVYAGAQTDHPAQGEIVIETLFSQTGKTQIDSFLTPTQLGTIRIVAVQDKLLTLMTPKGKQLNFNLETRKFQ